MPFGSGHPVRFQAIGIKGGDMAMLTGERFHAVERRFHQRRVGRQRDEQFLPKNVAFREVGNTVSIGRMSLRK